MEVLNYKTRCPAEFYYLVVLGSVDWDLRRAVQGGWESNQRCFVRVTA